jgi:hypothetical protein
MTDCNGPGGSVNCTTFFANGPMPMTNCTSTAIQQPPVQSPTAPAPPPPDPGFYYYDSNGAQYARLGTFFKGADSPAIYVAAYGQLR